MTRISRESVEKILDVVNSVLEDNGYIIEDYEEQKKDVLDSQYKKGEEE